MSLLNKWWSSGPEKIINLIQQTVTLSSTLVQVYFFSHKVSMFIFSDLHVLLVHWMRLQFQFGSLKGGGVFCCTCCELRSGQRRRWSVLIVCTTAPPFFLNLNPDSYFLALNPNPAKKSSESGFRFESWFESTHHWLQRILHIILSIFIVMCNWLQLCLQFYMCMFEMLLTWIRTEWSPCPRNHDPFPLKWYRWETVDLQIENKSLIQCITISLSRIQ